jgi:hypothetical protein
MSYVTESTELQSASQIKWLPVHGEKLNIVLMCVVSLMVPYWGLLSTQGTLWAPVFETLSISSTQITGEDYFILLSLKTGHTVYDGTSKSFRTGRLERELQMVQLSAPRCSNLVSLTDTTLCVASQQVSNVVCVYFVTETQSGNVWIHLRILFV